MRVVERRNRRETSYPSSPTFSVAPPLINTVCAPDKQLSSHGALTGDPSGHADYYRGRLLDVNTLYDAVYWDIPTCANCDCAPRTDSQRGRSRSESLPGECPIDWPARRVFYSATPPHRLLHARRNAEQPDRRGLCGINHFQSSRTICWTRSARERKNGGRSHVGRNWDFGLRKVPWRILRFGMQQSVTGQRSRHPNLRQRLFRPSGHPLTWVLTRRAGCKVWPRMATRVLPRGAAGARHQPARTVARRAAIRRGRSEEVPQPGPKEDSHDRKHRRPGQDQCCRGSAPAVYHQAQGCSGRRRALCVGQHHHEMLDPTERARGSRTASLSRARTRIRSSATCV